MGRRFSETYARKVARKILSAVAYCHSKGIAHRDLKLANFVFESNKVDSELKIIDFGFATAIEEKDGSGLLDTYCGTPGYMAPEINAHKKYRGTEVDIFALGVLLFQMVSQKIPFNKAFKADKVYNLIINNKFDLFWRVHKENSPDLFSEDLQELLSSIFSYESSHRPSISELLDHRWFNGPTATADEVKMEFKKRYESMKATPD